HARIPAVGVLVYFATLIGVMALADPSAHTSTGVHQEVGECYVEARDIAGLTRHRYLCARDYDEDFAFPPGERPADGTTWYTIVGRAHTAFGAHMAAVAALGVAGALVFLALFGARRRRERRS